MGRRRFGHDERKALYLVSEGRCQHCGEVLPAGWHADHRHPYALGGATALDNGQALCPWCNLTKGGTVQGVAPWPADRALHQWQVQARAAWGRHTEADFLLVATPGGGKTLTALRIASDELLAGRVQRVAIIVPTDHLRTQWANAASSIGLQINPGWDNAGPDGPGFCGIVATYHQVGRAPDVHALLCRQRTLAIFDEGHHAADTQSWGDALRVAYGSAVRRLMLSGTPFRSDNRTIPFVSYEDGRSRADHHYSYSDALDDNVVRAIHFPNYEADLTWRYRGQLIRASFRESIPEEQARRRLRTALDADGEWLPAVIRQADQQLSTVRATNHSAAGGLIVCVDMWHARRVADIVRRVTGEAPIVAVSDDPDASAKIADFARGSQRWLVAVRMVSEGVDVPRLRVGVYATNIISELYFRQLVGRFVRVIPGIIAAEQSAWLYLPADATLTSYAYRLAEERDHQIEEMRRQEDRLREAAVTDDGRTTGDFTPISSDNPTLVDVIIGEERFTGSDLEVARLVRLKVSMGSLTDAQVALILRAGGMLPASPAAADVARKERVDEATPLYQLRKNLRTQTARLVSKLAAQTGASHDTINRWLARETGAYVKEATIEQLTQRRDLLLTELERSDDERQSTRG
jgi:superfamily II DNA or RNA helicase